jgi:hypothetical protein
MPCVMAGLHLLGLMKSKNYNCQFDPIHICNWNNCIISISDRLWVYTKEESWLKVNDRKTETLRKTCCIRCSEPCSLLQNVNLSLCGWGFSISYRNSDRLFLMTVDPFRALLSPQVFDCTKAKVQHLGLVHCSFSNLVEHGVCFCTTWVLLVEVSFFYI